MPVRGAGTNRPFLGEIHAHFRLFRAPHGFRALGRCQPSGRNLSSGPGFGPWARRHPALAGAGGFLALLVLIILFWDWNWLKPFVEMQASSALGRKVTIGNLAVRVGMYPVVAADHIAIGNPNVP